MTGDRRERRLDRGGGSGSETDSGRAAVLFDMDGVLLEGRGTDPAVHTQALEDLLADRGLDVDDARRAALSGYEYTDTFVDACAAVGVDPAAFYTAREERSVTRTIERIADGARQPYDDVNAVDRLPDRMATGVVSNNYDPVVTFVIERFGLDGFGVVRGRDLGPDGFRRRKPDPHYLNRALDALGADRGLYVGDRETDIVAAGRAGLDGVFLRREHNTDADLDVEPAATVDGLDAVVDAAARLVE